MVASCSSVRPEPARLVIRSGLGDGTRRGRTTRVTDALAHFAGWMQALPKCYPTQAGLRAQLEGAGLRTTFSPLMRVTFRSIR